jgi:1-acyl-sn-glycerol-3-phosphate acyltransferase
VTKRLSRARSVFVYFLSWLVFGAVGLLLNVACFFLMALPGRRRFGPAVRTTIRWLFGQWIAWLRMTGTILVEWVGFDGEEALDSGTVYIANHPSIVDATLILARLPDAVCIFKPSLMRNPAIGPAAIMAGYVRGDIGLDLMKDAASRVAAGQSLLVFPEGTRTRAGTTVGHMKPGFALIADRAKAPVRLLVIRATPGLGEKGRPWWPAPAILPGRVRITLDQSWPYEPGRPAEQLTRAVESRVCCVIGGSLPP